MNGFAQMHLHNHFYTKVTKKDGSKGNVELWSLKFGKRNQLSYLSLSRPFCLPIPSRKSIPNIDHISKSQPN